MKVIKVLITIALLANTAAALADPPAQVGRLNHLQGTVSFASADPGNEWMVAQLNWPVTTGDRLWADRDGRAEMRIGSTAIRVNALTSVDILRLDDQATQLRLPQGTLNIRLRQLDPGDSFEVSTPGGAVLLTRPGSYRVHVDPAGATTAVLVRQGQADVLTGGNPPFSLHDNQFATLSNAGHHILGAPAPDEFDNWAFARDRQEERVVATRYVAPAMTGYEDLDQHGTWHSEPQYGNVWVPAVAALPVGWAPYRHGRWAWVSPWGWTWIDSAPWGFAPYHYGRWVWLGNRWAWAPGVRVARPVYAPALVAFVGGRNWSVSVASGPAVGWVPLGWREPYIPWYRHSPRYVRNVNVTHVTNVTVINQYSNVNNVARIRYVNRDVPSATTVVAHDTFVRARHVHKERLDVPAQALATAQVTHAAPVVQPGRRHSLAAEQPGPRLPQTVAAREVLAARAPLAPAQVVQEAGPGNARKMREENRVDNERKGRDERRAANERGAGNERGAQDDRPRVRILSAQAVQQPRTAPPRAQEATPQLAAPAGAVPMAPDAKTPADTRAADKARGDIKAGGEAPRRPALAMPPGERERAAERTPSAPDAKTPPEARERTRIAPDTKAAGEAPRPATLAPNDTQRQQQERQAREEQQRRVRVQQEKQTQEQQREARLLQEKQAQAQREQQQRAFAAQQQQERQARNAQQQQARALQQRQLQEQQEQQRQLQQQQQQRVLQQQQAAQQQRLREQRDQHQQAQQQRDQQYQQAQRMEQQRRAERQQHREERPAARRPSDNPEQTAPPQARARPKPEVERAPQVR